MNYKALEDLVNILVKKTGTDIESKTAEFEESKIDEKIKKLNKDKNKFKTQMSSKVYEDLVTKEKDENEKNYYKKNIDVLEECLKGLKEEVETFYKVDETGEIHLNSLLKELNSYESEARALQREIKHAKDNGLSKLVVLNNEYDNTNTKLLKVKQEMKRKLFLDEEIIRISDEICENKNRMNEVNTRITSSSYEDTLEKNNDEETLKSIEKEINLLSEKQNEWSVNAEILGGELLKKYKDGLKYEEAVNTLDKLVNMAVEVLKVTQKEITNSNIFTEMEKYNKLVADLKEKISKNKYKDTKLEKFNNRRKDYFTRKHSEYKDNLKEIDIRKNEVEKEIEELASSYEYIKNSRIELELDLFSLQNRFYSNDITDKTDREIKDMEKYIGLVKSDIESYKQLESELVKDVYDYKAELKNLNINYSTIKSKMEDVVKGLESCKNSDSTDKIEIVNDNLLYIEYENRLKSLVNEQQYLYVDPHVIKDEIKNIWNKGTTNIPNAEEDLEVIPDIIEVE